MQGTTETTAIKIPAQIRLAGTDICFTLNQGSNGRPKNGRTAKPGLFEDLLAGVGYERKPTESSMPGAIDGIRYTGTQAYDPMTDQQLV